MKILFLPYNIASLASVTLDALNKVDGIKAKGIIISTHKYQYQSKNIISLPVISTKKKPLQWLVSKLRFEIEVIKWILWADVIHYIWSPVFNNNRDIYIAHKLKKKIFVEFVGSDIRNPEILTRINPYYLNALKNGYEYANIENAQNSLKNQTRFSNYKAVPLLCPEMQMFLFKDIFPQSKILYQRMNVSGFHYILPNIAETRPLIVHSPSAKVAKGTYMIRKVIEKLKNGYDFEYQELHNISREEVLKVMEKADIFLDQIIVGGYGMASIEAMSFGKPVMCYIMPEVFDSGLAPDCPIINTNPDNLETQLVRLISDGKLRREIGIKSRAYVEKYHDADIVCKDLVNHYKNSYQFND